MKWWVIGTGKKLSKMFRINLERWESRLWLGSVAVVLIVGIAILWRFWEQLHDSDDPLLTTVKDVSLLVGGLIAMLLAVWRSRVAERQSTTAQRGLLNERYQKGAEMLGSDVLSVRLGGIYALRHLAQEYPSRYHLQVMQLFCAFVRHPTKDVNSNAPAIYVRSPVFDGGSALGRSQELRGDVQAVMDAIRFRSSEGISLETRDQFQLDLRGADLRGAMLDGADLSGAILQEVKLSRARLIMADLSGANLWHADLSCSPYAYMDKKTFLDGANLCDANLLYANLSGARLQEARLCGARLFEADLSDTFLYQAKLNGAYMSLANLTRAILDGADVSGVTLEKGHILGIWLTAHEENPTTRLTQEQLDKARADLDNPPHLNGVLDAATGKPLAWNG